MPAQQHLLPTLLSQTALIWRVDLRTMVSHSFLQDFMFGLAGSACHAACTANAAVRDVPSSGNFLAGIDHNQQLLKSVCQQLRDVPQQGSLACT